MPRYLSEPREDPRLPGARVPGPPRVLTCPHCLYSAGETTFTDIDDAERARLREALASLSLPPGGGEAAMEIARACEEERHPDARRAADLELRAHVERWRERTAEDRRRLRTLLAGALRDQAVPGGDRARLAYFLGEVSQQMGRTDEARRLHEASVGIARKGGPESDDPWVPGWAAAQLRRIELESWATARLAPLARGARPGAPDAGGVWAPPGDPEIAVQALAARDDREAWAVLADYAGEDIERLHALVRIADLDPDRLGLAPGLRSFARERYLRHGDDLLRDAVFEKGGRAPSADPRVLERFEAEMAAHSLSPDTEENALRVLPSLIREGSEEGAACLLRLVARPGSERTDYRVGESIEAVARTPALWTLVRESLPPPAPEASRAQLLLVVAAGASPGLPEQLVARLDEYPSEEERGLVLGVLGAMGDRSGVRYALRFCGREPGDWPCLRYLSAVGGAREAREIALLAKWTASLPDRWGLEDCLRTIHIRLATRPGSAPGPAMAGERP
jgi:hypothetical protein